MLYIVCYITYRGKWLKNIYIKKQDLQKQVPSITSDCKEGILELRKSPRGRRLLYFQFQERNWTPDSGVL